MHNLTDIKARELFTKEGMNKLIELSKCYNEYSATTELKESLKHALSIYETSLIESLNIISVIASKFYISDGRGNDTKYPFQGKEELYSLLDEIRFCFKELVWAAQDAGFYIKDNQAFNNTFGIS